MTRFLLPIEGLTITSPWETGRVQSHPGASARALLGPEAEGWFGHEIAGDIANRVAGELAQWTVAQVDAPDVDEALDLVTLATDLLPIGLMVILLPTCFRSRPASGHRRSSRR